MDIGPDFRSQALRYQIDHLDGLILTHTHYDHIAGIDELRIFYLRQQRPFPCLLSWESLEDLKRRYNYFFQPIGEVPTLSAQLEFFLCEEEIGELEFLGLKVGYCSYLQGGTKVNGFRVGDFAYFTDIKDYDDSVFLLLRGVQTLVLSALREESSPLHLAVQEAVDFAKRAGVKKCYLTHISHALDAESAPRQLPPEVELAFDGLRVQVTLDLLGN